MNYTNAYPGNLIVFLSSLGLVEFFLTVSILHPIGKARGTYFSSKSLHGKSMEDISALLHS